MLGNSNTTSDAFESSNPTDAKFHRNGRRISSPPRCVRVGWRTWVCRQTRQLTRVVLQCYTPISAQKGLPQSRQEKVRQILCWIGARQRNASRTSPLPHILCSEIEMRTAHGTLAHGVLIALIGCAQRPREARLSTMRQDATRGAWASVVLLHIVHTRRGVEAVSCPLAGTDARATRRDARDASSPLAFRPTRQKRGTVRCTQVG